MRLVIFGVGPLARLMQYYFEKDTDYEAVAFCVDREHLQEESFCGRPVVPFDEVGERYPADDHHMFVAIGYRRMRDRKRVYERAKAAGYRCASYGSPRAILHAPGDAGENNVFMDRVLMEPFASVGDNNLFWSGTLIGHECVIGSHNYVSANVIIGGQSEVADGCFLGNGAATINAIRLREETMLLPGALALRNSEPFTKYFGNPAKAIGTHREQGIVIERG
jgi:UDP-N-acetylbacillosamine N-acetyltransferase